MNVGEALALCTARSNHIGNFINGGKPDLTCQDLMMALAIVYASDAAKKLVRMKYLGEHELRHELEAVDLLSDVSTIAVKHKWRIDKPGTLGGLIHVAVDEYLGKEVCLWCNGQGSLLAEHKHIVCELCKGSGVIKMSERKRAEGAGIEHSRWERVWGDRYHVVRAHIFDLSDGVLGRMANRLDKSASQAHHPYKINEKIIL